MTPVDLESDHEYVWMGDDKCVGCEANRVQLAAHVRGANLSITAQELARLWGAYIHPDVPSLGPARDNYRLLGNSVRRACGTKSAVIAGQLSERALRRFQESK